MADPQHTPQLREVKPSADSSLVQRVTDQALAVVAEHAKTGRAIPWALVMAFTVAVSGAVGWRALEAGESECSPLVVQHVLHQAHAGAEQAERLDSAGHHEIAAAIRTLTDVDSQPDDVRLCVLISQREAAQ